MNKKYIILDTETTGLEVQQGHRVIEIGAVLLNDRKKSEENFHSYLNPERLIDDEASKVIYVAKSDTTLTVCCATEVACFDSCCCWQSWQAYFQKPNSGFKDASR